VAYVLRRSTLDAGLLLGDRTGALVTDSPFVDIDGPRDIAWAEFLLAQEQQRSAEDDRG
jgi:hypothetical protein